MAHRDATLTKEELTVEITRAYVLGQHGPGFCAARYVGVATCQRIGNHDGEHVTTGLTGRLVGWDD
ncbi:hypothetical protein SEA_JOHNDOE_60 [Arthrobacter phage JohnDoe]|nr:hypothetical protein SEA_JOHNDOE_60 [Arthrobacter phage JohnDoe]